MRHIKPKNVAEFDKAVSQAKSDGFVALTPNRVLEFENKDNSPAAQWNDEYSHRPEIVSESQQGDGMRRGGLMGTSARMLDYSQNISVGTPDGVGKDGLGYIPWGPFNDIPSAIFKISASLPYTAQGLQYLSDTATGLGPRLMYHLARYSGGTVTDEHIRYEDAGTWLRNRERELLSKIAELEQGLQPQQEQSLEEKYIYGVEEKKPSASDSLVASYRDELEEVRRDFDEWKVTMGWWKTFTRENNLDQHYQKCMAEDARLDIYFPTVGLSRGRAGSWSPQITRVGHLDACCTRFEEKDENWKINNVYYSEAWRDDIFQKSTQIAQADDIVAYPVCMPDSALKDITDYVSRNQRTKVGQRNLWFCCPQYYPTPTKPYYPQPAWWSVFPSQVFQYASTLIYDKSVARKNNTMWGKILFVNISYLRQLFDQAGADTAEKQQKIRDSIYNDVDSFLKRRDNNGKLLVMDSYMSADEKNLIDSVRIVDVPNVATPTASDGELAQISSIIYFALGLHPGLIGSDTTKGSSSSGGTFQRELHLLKVTQLNPRQRRYIDWLNSILRFNGLDEHAVFVIKQATLSTLDRSATGVVETESE